MAIFTEEQIDESTIPYFGGDKLAANVWKTKYALKNKAGQYMELNPKDMHQRLAREFARIEAKFGTNAMSEEEIFDLLDHFKYIVPQGSPMFGIGNNEVNISLSNCVVVPSPEDSISSIMETAKSIANLFKRRCGVGLDLSDLRPERALVSNAAGTSTGAWSFADFYSYVCRMIGQAGRRGALMLTMDVRHPDIFKYATMKNDESKITGANVSIKMRDDFMEAVVNDEDYMLRWPVDSKTPKYAKTIKARDLWDVIKKSATNTGDPGLLMWDNIINNLPAESYADFGFKTISTNPCGELPLSGGDSCRLISINLKSFVNDRFSSQPSFDFDRFKSYVGKAMRLSDDLVELEIEKLENILNIVDTEDEKTLWGNMLKSCKLGRRTGLGTHGLADALAGLTLRYDSDKALVMVDKIYEAFRDAAYSSSIELAKERGAFGCFNWKLDKQNAYIKRLPHEIKEQMALHGRRNIALLTNAPTGTVSLESQCSSGIEPVFRNSFTRRKKLSHDEQNLKADFVDDMGDRWQEYEVYHHNVKEWIAYEQANLSTGNPNIITIDDLPSYFVTSDQIDWNQRIKIQAAIQRHIDHSISSTINLPKGTHEDVVGGLYVDAWKNGLKGVTIYVEGSKAGVLVANNEEKPSEFLEHQAPKRPASLECDIHQVNIKGEKWTILVGILNGKPYETLGGLATLIEIPKAYKKGTLVKRKYKTQNNKYDLHLGTEDDAFVLKDVVQLFDNPDHAAFTRMISLSLRHGAKISYVVEQLQKDKDADMFSFSKCLSRVLKVYIGNGTKVTSDKTCTSCGEDSLIYVEGCVSCASCGFSKCS